MKRKNIKIRLLSSLAVLVVSCSTQNKVEENKTKPKEPIKSTIPSKKIENKTEEITVSLPAVNREFRAAWVATVANINWPSKGNYSTYSQKAEAIAILDKLKSANFNAVIFQARPSADAFYKSNLEPWSYFLTGEQGKAPNPYYDPLEFWITEAHKRGLQLHIWLNPYRAHHSNGGNVSKESMATKMSSEVYRLKNGMYWMDPASENVQNHLSAVIKDIVKRYDVDAVHIDDYFYPYKEYNSGADFPDAKTWNDYQRRGGELSRADWRRAEVNKFIKRIYTEIKAEKSSVQFGISPFGIWKPGYPEGIKGSSQYDELYADAKLWLNQGWLDYFSPQLYWKIGGAQDFNSLLSWWESENTKGRHIWPGLNTIAVRTSLDKPTEIVNQINSARDILKTDAGEIHYSMDAISKNYAMYSALRNAYSSPALVPVSPWIKTPTLSRPELSISNVSGSVLASWKTNPRDEVFHWVLYTQYGKEWSYQILDKDETSKSLASTKSGKKLEIVAITSVDKLGNESLNKALKVK